MKFKIIGRRYDVTDKIRDYVEKKLGKLDKFFKDESEARVVIGTIKDNDYIETAKTAIKIVEAQTDIEYPYSNFNNQYEY